MDAHVIAAHNDYDVILWHQRGLSPKGTRFDGEVLGLYTFRDGKLARAQMFHFDTLAVAKFLTESMSFHISDFEPARACHARFPWQASQAPIACTATLRVVSVLRSVTRTTIMAAATSLSATKMGPPPTSGIRGTVMS